MSPLAWAAFLHEGGYRRGGGRSRGGAGGGRGRQGEGVRKKEGGRRFREAALAVGTLGPAGVGEGRGRKGVRGLLGLEEGGFRGAGEQGGALGVQAGCLGFGFPSSSLAHIDGSSLAHIDLRAQFAPEGGRQGRECVHRRSLYRFSQRGLAICRLASPHLLPCKPRQHHFVEPLLLSLFHLVDQPLDLQLPGSLLRRMEVGTPVAMIVEALVFGEPRFGGTSALLGAGFGCRLQQGDFLNSVAPQKRHFGRDVARRESRGKLVQTGAVGFGAASFLGSAYRV